MFIQEIEDLKKAIAELTERKGGKKKW
jgi:hypothetical protein